VLHLLLCISLYIFSFFKWRLPLVWIVLMLKHDPSIKKRSSIVLRTVCHALEWYTIKSLFCNIYVVRITLYLNMSIFNFLFYMSAQHFPYMCENFTVYVSELTRLLLFLCLFQPFRHRGQGYLKGTSYKVLTIWLLKHSLSPLITNHIVLPFWLWFFFSVHPVMASSPTHCLMWELYRSCPNP
jgi:hypothetical protein